MTVHSETTALTDHNTVSNHESNGTTDVTDASPAANAIPQNGSKLKTTEYKVDVVWINVLGILVLHILALYGLKLMLIDANWKTSLFSLFTHCLAIIGTGAGAHRLWCHRSYSATLLLRLFLAVCNSVAFQDCIFDWSRNHRVHHKFSETDADPYNAKRGFFFAHIGWLMCRKHPEVFEGGKLIDLRDLRSDPIVMFQRKCYIASEIPNGALDEFFNTKTKPIPQHSRSNVVLKPEKIRFSNLPVRTYFQNNSPHAIVNMLLPEVAKTFEDYASTVFTCCIKSQLQYVTRYFLWLGPVFSVFLATAVPYYFWEENVWHSFFVCFVVRYVVGLHAQGLVNSAAHLWGDKPYDKTIHPSENLWANSLTLGEGFHNFHHTFPWDYSASEWGTKFNLSTAFIDMCSYLGLAYNLKKVAHETVDRRRQLKGDGSKVWYPELLKAKQ